MIRAQIYTHLAEYDKALSDFKICIENDFNSALCHWWMGLIHQDLNQFEEVVYHMEKTIELKKDEPQFQKYAYDVKGLCFADLIFRSSPLCNV